MSEKNEKDELAYSLIGNALLDGIIRLGTARLGVVASMRLLRKEVNKQTAESLATNQVAVYESVVSASLLVYATSMFDAFLSDTTRFLLNLNIGALGKSCQVPIEVLASPKAAARMINKEIERKIRSIAYKSFVDRINFLRDTFGLRIQLTESVEKRLLKLTEVRNRIVHDQSPYSFEFDENQERIVKPRPIPGVSIPLNDDNVALAQRIYLLIAVEIVRSVRKDVLQLENPTSLDEGLESYFSSTAYLETKIIWD